MALVTSALYSRDVLRLAASIPHQARLVHPQASSEKRAPLCGSRIVVDVVSDIGSANGGVDDPIERRRALTHDVTGAPETGINVDRLPGPRGPVTYRDLWLRQYRVVGDGSQGR